MARLDGRRRRLAVDAVASGSSANGTVNAAVQELARHVEDVRVTEHQVIRGKPVTTIAGEIDTAGHAAVGGKLGSLAEDASFDFDLSKLGLDIGDIPPSSRSTSRTHLLDSALVGLRDVGRARASSSTCATGSRARTSRSTCLLRAASSYPRGVGRTANGGCACPPSCSRRGRSSRHCEARSGRTSRPAPSRCSRSRCSRGRGRARHEHGQDALRRPALRPAHACDLDRPRRRLRRLPRALHRRRRSLCRARGLGSLGTFPPCAACARFAVAPLALSRSCSGRSASRSSAPISSRRQRRRRRRRGDVFYAAALGFSLWASSAARRRSRRPRLELVALARRLGLVALFLAAFSIVF